MTWGPHVERFEKRRELGKDSPGARKALDERPTIRDDVQWILKAFYTLSKMRSYIGGMAVSPAPLSFEAIDRYASRYVFGDHDEFDRFSTLVSAMDSEFLKHHAAESKKKKPKK